MTDYQHALHKAAWEKVLANAGERTYQKYGLYGSRILSVRYPEVYLRGDDLFWEMASTVAGFQQAYEVADVADRCLMDFPDKILSGENVGQPLSMTRIDSGKYRVVNYEELYPAGYPVLSWLDQRMAPLAVTLKDKLRRLTPAERAAHEYFRIKESGAPAQTLFLIVCDDQGAYLYSDGVLWSAREGETVSCLKGNPVLIFNEESAWYPLMERLDTASFPTLARIVDSYSTDTKVPRLDPWEYEQVVRLRYVTQLDTERQFDLATLAAGRAHGIGRFGMTEVWDRVLPHQEFTPLTLSMKLGVLKECNRFASHLCPATAYLASLILQDSNLESGIRAFGREYLTHTGVIRKEAKDWKKPGRVEAWGHLWGCCLFEYDVEDLYRTQGGGHCISQAMAMSPALDLAGVPHYVTHFNRGGIGARDHHFVYSCDGEFVIDDGIVNYFAKDHPTTNNWGSLLSFSRDGRWAGTIAGQFYGNVSPGETMEVIAEIERMIDNKFTMHFLSFLDGQECEISRDEFLGYLKAIEPEWEAVTLP